MPVHRREDWTRSWGRGGGGRERWTRRVEKGEREKNKKGRKVDVSSVRKRLIRRDRGSLRCERLLHSESIRHTHTGLLYICMKRGAQNYRRVLATNTLFLPFFFPSPSLPPFSRPKRSRNRRKSEVSVRFPDHDRSSRSARLGIIGDRLCLEMLQKPWWDKVYSILSVWSIEERKRSVPKSSDYSFIFEDLKCGVGILLEYPALLGIII